MGDIADMMLDGTLCEQCGEFIDDDEGGYPRLCALCQQDQRPAPPLSPRRKGGSMYPKRITAVVSPEQLALIEEAAKAQNRSLSSFILDSALKAAMLSPHRQTGENNDRREGK